MMAEANTAKRHEPAMKSRPPLLRYTRLSIHAMTSVVVAADEINHLLQKMLKVDAIWFDRPRPVRRTA